ncbi:MAG: PspA/IM30 family protein [Spirochaetia bacterium]|jgi:phage shock protein A|nr:PspA/IM30 family protein [Spirochaetia bacterium]
MSIFSRFMDIVNSNVNALLDKAEDPEKMIKLMIQEMEDTLIELKTSCAATMANEARTKRQVKELEATMHRWQDRAILAIQKGREDLAKEALLEKKKASEKLTKTLTELDNLNEDVKVNKDEISQLNEKLASVKLKYKTMQDRTRRAEEETAARDSMHTNSEVFGHFSQMEEKIDRMNARNELDKTEGEDLEKKFSDLEGMDDIEKELNSLKDKLKDKEELHG